MKLENLQSKYCELSIELPHVYLFDFIKNPNIVETSVQGVLPIYTVLKNRFSSDEHSVSTCVMIDDYFLRAGQADTVDELINAYLDVCERYSIQLNYIVREGSCSSTVEKLLHLISEAPRPGAGSRGGIRDQLAPDRNWLSNGDALRITYQSEVAGKLGSRWMELDTKPTRANYNHSVFLDVQLKGDVKGVDMYSCPVLAAWWQLIRLGLDQHDGMSLVPPDTIVVNDDVSFFSKRAFSFLDSRFIEVEHAVNCILSNLSLPKYLTNHLQATSINKKHSDEYILDRIAYFCSSPDFFKY